MQRDREQRPLGTRSGCYLEPAGGLAGLSIASGREAGYGAGLWTMAKLLDHQRTF